VDPTGQDYIVYDPDGNKKIIEDDDLKNYKLIWNDDYAIFVTLEDANGVQWTGYFRDHSEAHDEDDPTNNAFGGDPFGGMPFDPALPMNRVNDTTHSPWLSHYLPFLRPLPLPSSNNIHQSSSYRPPPKELPAFPGARRVKPKTSVKGGGGLRARWKDFLGRILEWDSQHGALEVYDKRGKHLGEFDPDTGAQTKPPDPTRRVEP